MTAKGRIFSKLSKGPHCRKRGQFTTTLQFIPMPQAMKIPAAKAAVDKEWEKLDWKDPGVEPDESQKRERGDRWSNDEGRKSSFCLTDGHLSFEECWIGGKAPKKKKGRVALRGDIVKDDSGSYAAFTEQGSSASQMTAAKVMEIIQTARMLKASSRRSICLYLGKNGRCSKIIEKSQIGMSSHSDSSTTTQMAKIMVQCGRPSHSSWAKSVWSSFGRTVMGKAIWENPIEVRLGEGFQLGMLIRTPWKRVILICVCGWHRIGWKETKH